MGLMAGLEEEGRGLGLWLQCRKGKGRVCIGAHCWSVLLLTLSPVPSTGAGRVFSVSRPPTVFWSSSPGQ